jgi:hypothetical protein
VTPRHEAPGDLHHAEHNAITDQAAQLLTEWNWRYLSDDEAREWVNRALAVLREVARG